jgi:hypothetical protein
MHILKQKFTDVKNNPLNFQDITDLLDRANVDWEKQGSEIKADIAGNRWIISPTKQVALNVDTGKGSHLIPLLRNNGLLDKSSDTNSHVQRKK